MNLIQFIFFANLIRYIIIKYEIINILGKGNTDKNSGYNAFTLFIMIFIFIKFRNIYTSFFAGMIGYFLRYILVKLKIAKSKEPFLFINNLLFFIFTLIFGKLLGFK